MKKSNWTFRDETHSFVSIAGTIGVKWELDRLCKIGQVRNGLFESEVLQILGGESIVGRRLAVVPV
jgi:hypothetical protein